MFEFPEFSVFEEENDPKSHHLEDSSDEGNLSGVEPEPTDGVVVQDVDDVGDQDQSHSTTERSPSNNIKTIISRELKIEKPGERISPWSQHTSDLWNC